MKITFNFLFLRYTSLLMCFLLILFSSCTTYKNVPYFHDISDTSKPVAIKTVAFKSPVIQPDDILNIVIQTIDPAITGILNTGNSAVPTSSSTSVMGASTMTVTGQQTVSGYLVDKNGDIELPFAGKIKLQGLTTMQAKDTIVKALSKYVNNPIVSLRFANFRVTVLGEVLRPSTYIIPNEKINILDALGLAGDLTIYGRRENVLLIRDTLNDQKNMIRLNLNSKEIVASPYFYLQPNDMIYVEPSKTKSASADAIKNRNITIYASALSVLLVIVTRIN
jgi:polysaccharide biosynthesis/export protein